MIIDDTEENEVNNDKNICDDDYDDLYDDDDVDDRDDNYI